MTSILIVEDDNDINNLICNTLKAEGYQCERAFDGKEGADKIEQNRYDLLLLDIMLPEINGYELFDYVRGIGDTPVIIISAMGQVDERIRGLRMGADDYICKPFQIGELLARVETVLRRTQRMAERLEIEDVRRQQGRCIRQTYFAQYLSYCSFGQWCLSYNRTKLDETQ